MKKLITLLLFATAVQTTYAQHIFNNAKEIAQLKGGTTYIIINESEDDEVTEAFDYLKTAFVGWDFSEVKYITRDQITEHISPQSSFVSIVRYSLALGSSGYYYNSSRLELWTAKDNFELKPKGAHKKNQRVTIAAFELYGVNHGYDLETNTDNILPVQLFKQPVSNWGPGYLKNYIQMFSADLNGVKEHEMHDNIKNAAELKKLQTDTLYVPKYLLLKAGVVVGQKDSEHDPAELFKKYKNPYKLISGDELNDKIMQGGKPVYYLLYVHGRTDKMINIIKSDTGEIIYSTSADGMAYNLNAGDLEKIAKGGD